MNRLFAVAAVWARTVCAGIMASSNGRASVTPAPLRNVRRGNCFLEMNMLLAPLPTLLSGQGCGLLHLAISRLLSLQVHLKRLALHDAEHERRETIIRSCTVASDCANERHILVVDAAAERVNQESLSDDLYKLVRVPKQPRPQPRRPIDLRAVEELRRRINLASSVLSTPQRDSVEVLQREADRIHHAVTRDAILAYAVIQHLLPHRRFLGVTGCIRHPWRKRRHVGWWIRRAHAENVRHDPLAPRHRRRPFRL